MPRRKKPKGAPRVLADLGTPELRAKRAVLVGKDSAQELAAYPMGVLLAQGVVSQDEHNAAMHYAWLYGRNFGRTVAKQCDWLGLDVGRYDTSDLGKYAKELEREWRRAKDAMLAKGRRVSDAVENMTVFDRWPRWLKRDLGYVHHVRLSDAAERKALQEGVAILATLFYGANYKARAA